MFNIAVLVSGAGTNLQSIIDAYKDSTEIKICAVVSNNENAYGLTRAKQEQIPTFVFNKKNSIEPDEDILKVMQEYKVNLIVLAGYLPIISSKLIEAYPNKIINIHPSLIPSFCGKNMYGERVHEAALFAGVKVSGCTVHFVNDGIDTGPIIIQKAVEVKDDDTVPTLAKRVLEQEHIAIVEAIALIAKNCVKVVNDKTKINRQN